MLKRFIVFFYGVACYAVFLATYLYAIGFVGNVYVSGELDTTYDTSGPIQMPSAASFSVDSDSFPGLYASPRRRYGTASIRSSATRASRRVSSSTVIWLTTSPATRCSSTQRM